MTYTITLARINELPALLEEVRQKEQRLALAKTTAVSTAVAEAIRLILEQIDAAEMPLDTLQTMLYVAGHNANDEGEFYDLGVFDYSPINLHDRKSAPSIRTELRPEGAAAELKPGEPDGSAPLGHEVVHKLAGLLPAAIATRYPEGNVTVKMLPRGLVFFEILVSVPASLRPAVKTAVKVVAKKPTKAKKAAPARKEKHLQKSKPGWSGRTHRATR